MKRKRTVFNETPIYREASVFLQGFTKVCTNMKKLVQYSIGKMVIQDATNLVKSIVLAYEADTDEKIPYLDKAWEEAIGIQAMVNLLCDGKHMSLKQKTHLYLSLGAIDNQLRAWKTSLKAKQSKETSYNDNNNINETD